MERKEETFFHLTTAAFPTVQTSRLRMILGDSTFQLSQQLIALRKQTLAESGDAEAQPLINEAKFKSIMEDFNDQLQKDGWSINELSAARLVAGGLINIEEFDRH